MCPEQSPPSSGLRILGLGEYTGLSERICSQQLAAAVTERCAKEYGFLLGFQPFAVLEEEWYRTWLANDCTLPEPEMELLRVYAANLLETSPTGKAVVRRGTCDRSTGALLQGRTFNAVPDVSGVMESIQLQWLYARQNGWTGGEEGPEVVVLLAPFFDPPGYSFDPNHPDLGIDGFPPRAIVAHVDPEGKIHVTADFGDTKHLIDNTLPVDTWDFDWTLTHDGKIDPRLICQQVTQKTAVSFDRMGSIYRIPLPVDIPEGTVVSSDALHAAIAAAEAARMLVSGSGGEPGRHLMPVCVEFSEGPDGRFVITEIKPISRITTEAEQSGNGLGIPIASRLSVVIRALDDIPESILLNDFHTVIYVSPDAFRDETKEAELYRRLIQAVGKISDPKRVWVIMPGNVTNSHNGVNLMRAGFRILRCPDSVQFAVGDLVAIRKVKQHLEVVNVSYEGGIDSVWLSTPHFPEPDTIGQKAYALWLMQTALNLPVPDAFALNNMHYINILETNGVLRLLNDLIRNPDRDKQEIMNIFAQIRKRLTPVNPAQWSNTRSILSRHHTDLSSLRVSVRSSASIEDLAESPQAGVFHTDLDVPIDSVPDSILHVIQSLFCDEVASIVAAKRDIERPAFLEQIFMGVIIQEMVQNVRWSGTVFGCDAEMKDPGIAVIELQNIVGGGVGSYRTGIQPEEGLRTLRIKVNIHTRDIVDIELSNGGKIFPQSLKDLTGTPFSDIDKTLIHRIIHIITNIETSTAFGYTPDLEICCDGNGKVWFLQCRPAAVPYQKG